eukprot:768703-Hanusia_phi.AAC.4
MKAANHVRTEDRILPVHAETVAHVGYCPRGEIDCYVAFHPACGCPVSCSSSSVGESEQARRHPGGAAPSCDPRPERASSCSSWSGGRENGRMGRALG